MTDRHIRLVQPDSPPAADDMKSFLLVVRRALLLVIDFIETKYQLQSKRR